MEEREFFLNWEKDTLQGWEYAKGSIVIASMIEGIKLGHKFPAVRVVKVGDNFYRLALGNEDSDGYDDGGHHRAVAHYITGEPLRCSLLNEEYTISNISISAIEMRDWVSDDKLMESLGYLPRDIAERFCRENNLDSDYYLSRCLKGAGRN